MRSVRCFAKHAVEKKNVYVLRYLGHLLVKGEACRYEGTQRNIYDYASR